MWDFWLKIDSLKKNLGRFYQFSGYRLYERLNALLKITAIHFPKGKQNHQKAVNLLICMTSLTTLDSEINIAPEIKVAVEHLAKTSSVAIKIGIPHSIK